MLFVTNRLESASIWLGRNIINRRFSFGPETLTIVVVNDSNNKSSVSQSLRETLVILVAGAVFCAWVVVYSYMAGYQPEDNFAIAFGLPSWVTWGVAVPWLAANLLTAWFCFGYMKDEDTAEAFVRNESERQDE